MTEKQGQLRDLEPMKRREPTCIDGAIRFCVAHPETVYTLEAAPVNCQKDGQPLICDHIQFKEPCA